MKKEWHNYFFHVNTLSFLSTKKEQFLTINYRNIARENFLGNSRLWYESRICSNWSRLSVTPTHGRFGHVYANILTIFENTIYPSAGISTVMKGFGWKALQACIINWDHAPLHSELSKQYAVSQAWLFPFSQLPHNTPVLPSIQPPDVQ